jgi:CheY-like chemotaxis protein
MISNLQAMLKRLIGENIELSFKPCKEDPAIVMDPSQLDQILANLVLNAKDAINSIGKIQIETDITETEEMVTYPGQKIASGKYAVLSVSDNGAGMSQAIQLQIFEPFFTTKPEGKGTGLGLSTVYGIVEQYHGGVSVFSEEGSGTTFRLYLPLFEKTNEDCSAVSEKLSIHSGCGKILLVEDEKALIRLIKSMLEKLGYQVHAFSSPVDALSAVKSNEIEFDLVLSDVVMPMLNGPELIEKILAIRPESRVMFMSGYAADVISKHLKMVRSIPLIEKPFDISTLSRKVKEVMNENL